jgi:hypothetical protein
MQAKKTIYGTGMLFFLILILCISGCGYQGEATEPVPEVPAVSGDNNTQTNTDASATAEQSPIVLLKEQPLDNRAVYLNGNFIETEDSLYSIPFFGGLIMGWDKTNHIGGPLCGRPECLHNNDQCNAYVGSVPKSSLSLYQNRLYWVGVVKTDPQTRGVPGVYSMNPDGTDRRLELNWDYYQEGINNAYLNQGFVYAVHQKEEVDQADPFLRLTVRMIPIDGTDSVTILDRTGRESVKVMPFFEEKSVWFVLSSRQGETFSAQLLCWDTEKRELQEVLSKEGLSLCLDSIWKTEDGTIFLKNGVTNDHLFQLQDGELLPREDLLPNQEKYDMLYFSNGILIASGVGPNHNMKEDVIDTIVLVRKWDGTVLYEGPVSMNFQADLNSKWHYHALCALFGDENGLYYEYEWEDENGHALTTMVYYTLAGGTLREELMWAIQTR